MSPAATESAEHHTMQCTAFHSQGCYTGYRDSRFHLNATVPSWVLLDGVFGSRLKADLSCSPEAACHYATHLLVITSEDS